MEEYLARIGPADEAAMRAATQRQRLLTKPAGSLGVLEDLSVRVAGMTGGAAGVPAPAVVAVFAADHGVHAQGVSPWPQEVTAAMLANFAAGGAAVNAFAANNGVDVRVVDVGVATDVDELDIVHAKVRAGTRDLSVGPALTADEVLAAVRVGFELADQLVADGYRCLLTGDMGIANTTASAALIATFTGATAADVTGRGPGSTTRHWRTRPRWCGRRWIGTRCRRRTRSARSRRTAGWSMRRSPATSWAARRTRCR